MDLSLIDGFQADINVEKVGTFLSENLLRPEMRFEYAL